jgi:hypothetical protein
MKKPKKDTAWFAVFFSDIVFGDIHEGQVAGNISLNKKPGGLMYGYQMVVFIEHLKCINARLGRWVLLHGDVPDKGKVGQGSIKGARFSAEASSGPSLSQRMVRTIRLVSEGSPV